MTTRPLPVLNGPSYRGHNPIYKWYGPAHLVQMGVQKKGRWVSQVLWVLWICLFHSLFFWGGVGHVFVVFEVLEIANDMKSSHPFFLSQQ